MPKHLRLISHKLCPYVQRAVIVAKEKGIKFERVDIDLANKPDWFLAISPTGKVPVLEVTHDDGTQDILFESAVIAEYLDEISEDRLLPADPLARARERSWVEFGSAALGDIYQLYVAQDREQFEKALASIDNKLAQVEPELGGTYFAGGHFGLVDAAFAPVFRYFDVFERRAELNVLDRRPKCLLVVGGKVQRLRDLVDDGRVLGLHELAQRGLERKRLLDRHVVVIPVVHAEQGQRLFGYR